MIVLTEKMQLEMPLGKWWILNVIDTSLLQGPVKRLIVD